MAKAKRGRMRVRNARASKSHKIARILVTKAQAASLGEDWTDISCPFHLSAAQMAAAKAKKAKRAGRKK